MVKKSHFVESIQMEDITPLSVCHFTILTHPLTHTSIHCHNCHNSKIKGEKLLCRGLKIDLKPSHSTSLTCFIPTHQSIHPASHLPHTITPQNSDASKILLISFSLLFFLPQLPDPHHSTPPCTVSLERGINQAAY